MADRPETHIRRVLWLTKGLGRGGTERLLVDSVRHVDTDRFHVEVAYVLPWKDALVTDLESQGVPVHCLWPDARRPQVRWVAALRRLVDDREIDVVHTHMPMPSVAARLALPTGKPVVHTEHNVWARYRRPTRWANAWTYRRNAAVLAVSEAVARSIGPRQRRRGPPVEVLHQGIDPASVRRGVGARQQARDRLGVADGEPVVGTVGNLTAKKDHATMLRAAAQVVPSRPELRLVLVGAGPLEGDLRRLARQLGIDERVAMLGSRDDVAELLAGFDAFVLSSRHEGLPIALLEAMAAGVACVATRVGGVPEVITDGVDGLLVEAGDPSALALAVARLLDDEELRVALGEQARATAAGFDLGAAVRRTQDVYEEVLCPS